MQYNKSKSPLLYLFSFEFITVSSCCIRLLVHILFVTDFVFFSLCLQYTFIIIVMLFFFASYSVHSKVKCECLKYIVHIYNHIHTYVHIYKCMYNKYVENVFKKKIMPLKIFSEFLCISKLWP